MLNARRIVGNLNCRLALAGALLASLAGAQVSGYVYVDNGETCTPPVCISQLYDSWAGSPDVWQLITHNRNPGGGPGQAWASTPFSWHLEFEGGRYSYLAGSVAITPGLAFNLFSLARPADGCPFVHVATVANMLENFTEIDHPALNDNPAARLLVTPRRQDTRITEVPGVWFNTATARWNLFYQDTSTLMEDGSEFVVLTDACAVGLQFGPVQVAKPTNTVGAATTIEDAAIDGRPSAVLFIAQVWDEADPMYNDHAVGVSYDATSQRWQIVNEGGESMPLGARFFWAHATVIHNCGFEDGLMDVGFDGWVGGAP